MNRDAERSDGHGYDSHPRGSAGRAGPARRGGRGRGVNIEGMCALTGGAGLHPPPRRRRERERGARRSRTPGWASPTRARCWSSTSRIARDARRGRASLRRRERERRARLHDLRRGEAGGRDRRPRRRPVGARVEACGDGTDPGLGPHTAQGPLPARPRMGREAAPGDLVPDPRRQPRGPGPDAGDWRAPPGRPGLADRPPQPHRGAKRTAANDPAPTSATATTSC